MNQHPARVAVIGATGYTGREAVALLHAHPGTEIIGLFGSQQREQPVAFSDIFPRYRGIIDTQIEAMDVRSVLDHSPDAVFMATPHEVSHDLVHEFGSDAGVLVDLSAAFRIPHAETIRKWYSIEHSDESVLSSAVYGLVEHARDALLDTDLLSMPGCYPTAALLGLIPIAQAGGLAPGERVSVIGISGVSGAGRAASTDRLFSEVALKPYAVSGHRHLPEITHHLRAAGAQSPGVVFTPHVGPWDRGMVVTSHATLADGWDAARVADAFAQAYPKALTPFVRLLPQGQWPTVAGVAHTNYCDIAWHVEGSTLVVTSAIDNLLKGAAGQAVQAWNIRMGFEETAGLLPESASQRLTVGGQL